MSIPELAVIGLGGFLGAVTRYLFSIRLNDLSRLPFGTLLVNLVGAFLIGCVFGLKLSALWTFFLASGFAGALTTFSTLMKEIVILWQNSHRQKAVTYTLMTFLGGVLLAMLGYMVTSN